jgi:hypothetical protein
MFEGMVEARNLKIGVPDYDGGISVVEQVIQVVTRFTELPGALRSRALITCL